MAGIQISMARLDQGIRRCPMAEAAAVCRIQDPYPQATQEQISRTTVVPMEHLTSDHITILISNLTDRTALTSTKARHQSTRIAARSNLIIITRILIITLTLHRKTRSRSIIPLCNTHTTLQVDRLVDALHRKPARAQHARTHMSATQISARVHVSQDFVFFFLWSYQSFRYPP